MGSEAVLTGGNSSAKPRPLARVSNLRIRIFRSEESSARFRREKTAAAVLPAPVTDVIPPASLLWKKSAQSRQSADLRFGFRAYRKEIAFVHPCVVQSV
jgi:hypothetical protein